MTVICLLLFVGAMGKSAQFPLQRVAAGLDGRPDADLRADPCRDHGDRRIFMVARMSRCSSCRTRRSRW